ncbi:protein draper-like isoform X2 [Mercenaria mercenaria]|uniref:protein draper-like isoform X2 n=1 Tax=Mercenaria mercenaria TaxID=6596 RepID=UPI00234F80AF|nr:protein draper-like isoform X2 [Mercenaria mercenaria]
MVYGAGIEIAECKINCACCKNQVCGPLGYFEEGNCYHGCIAGYYGARCYQKCTYNCTKCHPDDTCTSCYDGYHLGANKDCTEKCPTGCLSCKSTGETCIACLDGMFGEFCNETCPLNCKNKKCDRNSGACSDGCQMHFVGIKCQNCDEGRYGENCEYACPERCSRGVCFNESGNCKGCNGNFEGEKCENCQTGYYGPYCNDKCSKNCFIDICDRNSGLCTHGCKSNYFGDRCCLQNSNCMKCSSNTECNECKSGFYGETCNKTCSSDCVGNLCKKETGVCVLGCHEKCDDHKCGSDVENQKPEDKSQTVIIVMGVIIALLALVVISLTASKIVVWRRKSTQRNTEAAIVTFENAISSTNAELRGDKENMSTRRDHIYYNTKEDNHDSEHEYEYISSAV